MGVIPYESQIDARSGRSGGARLRNGFGAEAFGALEGRALQQVGGGLIDVGDEMRRERNRDEQEEALYGAAMFNPEPALQQVKESMNPNGDGYVDAIRTTYTNQVEEYLNGFDNDNVRTDLRQRLLARLPTYTSQATAYESSVRQETSKSRTNQILDIQRNRVRANPTEYDDAISMGEEAIDLYLPPVIAGPAKQQLAYEITKDRFSAKLDAARNIDDLNAVAEELRDPNWQNKLMPRDYDDLLGKIATGEKAYRQQVTSEATAALKGMEERARDPMNIIPQEELVATQKAVAASGDISAQRRLARVQRDQSIVRSERKLTPAQLRTRIEEAKAKPEQSLPGDGLPADISGTVNATAQAYGLNASLLEGFIQREYGQVLRDKPGDYSVQAKGTSATGIMQFTEGTFLNLMKDPTVSTALGVDTANLSDAQILELRKDPATSIVAGAILAKQNGAQIEGAIGRPASDVELYMAHFLGAPEAIRFIQLNQTNSSAPAATLFPTAAENNASVFYGRTDGKVDKSKPLTVAEVQQNISASFVDTTGQVAYDDNQVREKMLTQMETYLNGPDALKYAASVGVVDLVPLDQEGGFAARGKARETASNYYGRQLAPFTTDEEAFIQQRVQEGSVNDVLGLMTEIQSMGSDTAKAAFQQLKIKSPAFAHAGLLSMNGDPATAADVVRGVKRMKDNPAALTGLDFKEQSAAAQFESVVGPALSRIDPSERQAAQEAALAYLVETDGAAGKKYNDKRYREAVERVLGGRIAKVNGEKTYIPAGLQQRDITRALNLMTLEDYVALSTDGSTPMHADKTPIDPRDMDDEVTLRAIGGDKYILADSEGAYLWTGKIGADGLPQKFIIDLSPPRVRAMLDKYAANPYPPNSSVQKAKKNV